MASTETEKLDGAVTGEVRLLIDGELTEAESGKRFDNINPATEEVLGQVADASVDDMGRAIAAARRAFDETDWSTNHAFRRRCLEQLQAAIESEREEYRAELVAEVGCPIMLTYGPQLDAPLEDGLLWPAQFIDQFEWERKLPDGHAFGGNAARTVVKEAAGVVGAIVPWNYPLEVTLQKVGQALATGNTMILKPAPDTPWNATAPRPARRRAHRHPGGRVQRDRVVGSPRRRGAGPRPARRPHLVHRIDGHRQAHHGEGRADDEAPVPRARRQVRRHRPRRRRLRSEAPVGGRRLRARRAGVRDAHAPDDPARSLRRRHRARRPGIPQRALRRSHRHGQHPGPAGERQAARAGARLHREGQGRRRPRRRRRWTAGASRARATSWSPRCSPTSTTR